MTNKKKTAKKGKLWGAFALGIGLAVAMVIMVIAIYFGYTSAYNVGTDVYPFSILGLKIYELHRVGGSYIGTAVGINMGIVCMACMALALGIEQIIIRRRHI